MCKQGRKRVITTSGLFYLSLSFVVGEEAHLEEERIFLAGKLCAKESTTVTRKYACLFIALCAERGNEVAAKGLCTPVEDTVSLVKAAPGNFAAAVTLIKRTRK